MSVEKSLKKCNLRYTADQIEELHLNGLIYEVLKRLKEQEGALSYLLLHLINLLFNPWVYIPQPMGPEDDSF